MEHHEIDIFRPGSKEPHPNWPYQCGAVCGLLIINFIFQYNIMQQKQTALRSVNEHNQ